MQGWALGMAGTLLWQAVINDLEKLVLIWKSLEMGLCIM